MMNKGQCASSDENREKRAQRTYAGRVMIEVLQVLEEVVHDQERHGDGTEQEAHSGAEAQAPPQMRAVSQELALEHEVTVEHGR
jgi:hypothetical protein